MHDHDASSGREHPCLTPPENASPEQLLRMCGHYLYHYSDAQHSQMRILRLLEAGGTLDQQELQLSMGIRPSSLSELISKLEAKDYIAREKSCDDKRRIVVHITAAGREALSCEKKKSNPDLVGALAPDEQGQLCELLLKLLSSWRSTKENL